MVKGILVNRHPDEAAQLRYQLKIEHADLIAEMQTIENLPTHERLQLARIRRAQQLKAARQKEKEWLKFERIKCNSANLYNSNGGGPVGNRALAEYRTHSNAVKSNGGLGFGRRHISFENSVVLLEAASRNDMQEVAELLEAGITPDAANEDGLTALHQCCIDNNVDMLKLLLEYGANVDAQDSDKWTPLHAAATCGHLELVRILIDHDANLLAVNTDGNMPYDLCDDETTLDFIEAEMSRRGVTQELIDETRSDTECQMLHDLMELAQKAGDLEAADHQGATPLHIAAANGYVRVVEFLLEMHVNVDAADNDLWTPVHAAACWGHLEVLEMLAQFGADLNAKNKDNETPSDICEDPEIREHIEQLKTEQESKRLAEAQRRRVRRSQSSNTRAQSVRRTSLRDKTLTTKKDAVEETRLRLQAREVLTVGNDRTALGNNSIDVGTQVTSVLSSSPMSKSSSFSSSANNNNKNNNNNNNTTNATDCQKRLQTATKNQLNHQKLNDNNCSYMNQNLNENVSDGGVGVILQQQQQSQDTVDAKTTTTTNGLDAEQLVSDYKTIECTETVQIQSSKEAANGKINVQVTVLVDTTQHTSNQAKTPVQLNQTEQQQATGGGRALKNSKNSINNNHNNGTNKNNNNDHINCNSYANINNRKPNNSSNNNNNNNNNNSLLLLLPLHHNSLSGGATLANLKKQRSLSRTNVLNSENGSVVVGANTANGNDNSKNNEHNQHQDADTTTPQLTCSNGKNHNNNNTNNNNKSVQDNNTTNNSIITTDVTPAATTTTTSTSTTQTTTTTTMGFNHSTLVNFQKVLLPHNNSMNNNVAAGARVIKFSGVPGDVVDDSTNSRRCCTLM